MDTSKIWSNTQANATAGSMSVTAELNRIESLKKQQQSDTTVTRSSRNDTSNLVNSTNSNEAGTSILADLAVNLSQLGVEFNQNTFSRRVDERANQQIGSDDVSDTVDIDSSYYAIQRNAEKRQNQQNGEQARMNDPETKALMKEYTSTYSQYLVNGSADLRAKLIEIEKQLRSRGFTDKDILSLQLAVKKSMRGEIAAEIKNTFFKRLLANENSIDYLIKNRSMNDVLDFAFNNERLGGWDFGGYNTNLQGTTNRAVSETADDTKSLVQDELENKLIEKHLNGSKTVDKQIKDLLKLGAKIGFNTEEFVKNWQEKKMDLGLFAFDIPLDNKTGQGGDQQQKNRNGYEFTREDEKDLMVNQLRALFMKRAISGDILTVLETSVKVRKLKNGLIKLGLTFEDLRGIEKEGKAGAKLRTMNMLKDTYLERATLYELSGPAFHLIEKTIKGLVSNMERLGLNLTKYELDLIRDTANRQMYDHTEHELKSLLAVLDARPNASTEKKAKLMVRLLKRLRDESGLQGELGQDIELLITRHEANIMNVKEHA